MKTKSLNDQTLIDLKKSYPNAKNIVFGNNNIVDGFWFENGENPKHRTFYPMNKN